MNPSSWAASSSEDLPRERPLPCPVLLSWMAPEMTRHATLQTLGGGPNSPQRDTVASALGGGELPVSQGPWPEIQNLLLVKFILCFRKGFSKEHRNKGKKKRKIKLHPLFWWACSSPPTQKCVRGGRSSQVKGLPYRSTRPQPAYPPHSCHKSTSLAKERLPSPHPSAGHLQGLSQPPPGADASCRGSRRGPGCREHPPPSSHEQLRRPACLSAKASTARLAKGQHWPAGAAKRSPWKGRRAAVRPADGTGWKEPLGPPFDHAD